MTPTDTLIIKKDMGVVGDRNFSFVRMLDKESAFNFQNKKELRNIINYFSLKSSSIFNLYSFQINQNNLSCYKQNKKIISIHNQDFDTLQLIVDAFKEEEKLHNQQIFFLHNKEQPFFDTVRNNTISLINLNSLRDFENKNSIKVDAERFRANIYMEDLDPWVEQNWIGKKITFSGTSFEVFATIPRCKATHFPYGSQQMDYNVPQLLQKTYGHIDLGIYLKPSNDATIALNSKVSI
jgi:hypothetical protein